MIRLKSYDDIMRIKESGHILYETMCYLEKLIAPGISTGELDKEARNFIQSKKAKPAFLNYGGFPGSICTSVNEEVIHGIPGRRRLRDGDVVGVDIGIDLKGFISDSAKTFAVGKIASDVQQLLDTTVKCLEAGISAAKFNNRIKDIGQAVFDIADAAGYGVVRDYCGHGVGYGVHESPSVPNYPFRGTNPRMKEGLVIAIEPMINIGGDDVDLLEDDWTVVTRDKSISAHFEHTVAIFADRTEILTL
ncbi:MAG: type I methionyl aminopeptidase [Spirochaetales bacterium]|nr:type I methionyl aminopeptidase [Spirochaetales bacterium]